MIVPEHSYDLSLATINPISDRTYTGKAVEPEPTITDEGYVLVKGTDYAVEYTNNINIGDATVTVTGIGKYYGAAQTTFKIIPKKTSISKLVKGKKKITVKWKAQNRCNGYQIRYSTKSNFKSSKLQTVSGSNRSSWTIKDLKATKYYVQIRTYAIVEGVNYYSNWSNGKSITIKQAVSKYRSITKTPVKVGAYYYKTVDYGSKIARSKKKNSGYSIIVYEWLHTPYTNGTYIYGIESEDSSDEDYLIRVSASGEGWTTVKTLPVEKYASWGGWSIDFVHDGYFYMTKWDGSNWDYITYSYNIGSKKLKKLMNNCSLIGSPTKNGGYMLGIRRYHSDVRLDAKDLYKILPSGKLKRIRRLGDSTSASFVGKKLYYVNFSTSYGSDGKTLVKGKVFRCNRNGKNNKKLGTFSVKSSDFYGNLAAGSYSSSSCKIYIGSEKYRFYYGSGKIKKIR